MHQMQKAGAFFTDYNLATFFFFAKFYVSLLHLVIGDVNLQYKNPTILIKYEWKSHGYF